MNSYNNTNFYITDSFVYLNEVWMGQLLNPVVLRYPFVCRAVKDGYGSAWGFVSEVGESLLFEGRNDILFEVDDLVTFESFEGAGMTVEGRITAVHQAEVYLPMVASERSRMTRTQVLTFEGISFEAIPISSWKGNSQLRVRPLPAGLNASLNWADGEGTYHLIGTAESGCRLTGEIAPPHGVRALLSLEGFEPIKVIIDFWYPSAEGFTVVASIDEHRIVLGQWHAMLRHLHSD